MEIFCPCLDPTTYYPHEIVILLPTLVLGTCAYYWLKLSASRSAKLLVNVTFSSMMSPITRCYKRHANKLIHPLSAKRREPAESPNARSPNRYRNSLLIRIPTKYREIFIYSVILRLEDVGLKRSSVASTAPLATCTNNIVNFSVLAVFHAPLNTNSRV